MSQNIRELVMQFGSATKLIVSTEHRETQRNNFITFVGTHY